MRQHVEQQEEDEDRTLDIAKRKIRTVDQKPEDPKETKRIEQQKKQNE